MLRDFAPALMNGFLPRFQVKNVHHTATVQAIAKENQRGLILPIILQLKCPSSNHNVH
jgi:hypothetical protein